MRRSDHSWGKLLEIDVSEGGIYFGQKIEDLEVNVKCPHYWVGFKHERLPNFLSLMGTNGA